MKVEELDVENLEIKDICFRTFNYYRCSCDFVKKYIKKYIIVF